MTSRRGLSVFVREGVSGLVFHRIGHGLGGFRYDDAVVAGKTPRLLTHTATDLRRKTVR